jgi:NADPH:quinone reductase-like Zn-dependent oxidoreductase
MDDTKAHNHSQGEVTLPVSFPALAVEDEGKPVILQTGRIDELNDDDVLVRVDYASMNNMDAGLARRNLFQLPAPYVLGFDFSGEVVRIGAHNPGGFHIGDQVFGSTARAGCFGHYVVTKNRSDRIRKRGAIPAREASTYGIAFLTAYESLAIVTDLEQHKGKWIYVAGAGGGVGHFAAQIAKLNGLKVIGSASKPASLQLLRQLGLDAVVDYSKQDVVAEVLRITGGEGAEVVHDSTYRQASYAQSTAVVAAGGEYIRLASDIQMKRFGLVDLAKVVEERGARMTIADLGRYSTDPQFIPRWPLVAKGLDRAVEWYEAGMLKPIVTRVIPFDAMALQKALGDFASGTINVGKVVVEITPQRL